MEIFKMKDLNYYYPNETEPALKDINLNINKGEFILVLGKSGSGKSTLARVFNGIVPEFYGGKISGEIINRAEIGMLFQDPEKQIIMDKVEAEIAFGLENKCMNRELMKKKVKETMDFLNIFQLKEKNSYELSGGQMQKVALGATIAVEPKIIVLDEPTSQLDNKSTEDILAVVKKLNEELGYTVILIEHRVDRCFHLADRIIYMDASEIAFDGKPKEFLNIDIEEYIQFMPTISQYFKKMNYPEIPYTIEAAEKLLKDIGISKKRNLQSTPKSVENINVSGLEYKYEDGTEALKGVDLSVFKGEILGIVGENGCGKSTLLKIISKALKPTKGTCRVEGKVGFLSQNPNDYLFNDTVYEELKFTLDNNGILKDSIIENILKDLNLLEYKDKNPKDLSGGEKQRVALASILVMTPEILIMDEPTRGLDKALLGKLGQLILKLRKSGMTIIVVTHDIDFIGKYCERVAILKDGKVNAIGDKYEVLNNDIYYETSMFKLLKTKEAITLEDALCGVM